MINKIEEENTDSMGEEIQPLVIAKICLNIAIIRAQLGDQMEAVYMHERSLYFKLKDLPQLSDEIRDQNILLAFA